MIKTSLFSALLFLASYLAIETLFATQPRTPQSDYIGVLSRTGSANVLYRVRVDDGETQLMAEFSGIADASGVWWSPDGRYLATAAYENHNIKRLFYVDMHGDITPLADFGWHTPTLSPDHQQMAILTFGAGGSGSDLAVMDIDGENRVQFQFAAIGNPQWSPDGEWIAFTDGPIYRVRPDGTDFEAITQPTLSALGLEWSPDGDWITFSGVTPNGDIATADVFIIRPDGSDLTQITDDLPNALDVAWSPNGANITFTAGEYGHQSIYRHNLADGSTIRLIDNRDRVSSPQWSPDGRRIAFRAYDTRSGCPFCFDAVYVMNADGSNLHQLTRNIAVSGFAWSPIVTP